MSVLLLQDGGALLLQDGGDILLVSVPGTICLVSPDVIRLKDADTIYLTCPTDTTVVEAHGGSKHAPSYETRAYWESEEARLRALRDDEELLLL